MKPIKRINAKRLEDIIRPVKSQDIRIVLELMTFYSLRLSEVLKLRKADVFDRGIKVYKEKSLSGPEYVFVPLSAGMMRQLKQFVSSRRINDNGRIFGVPVPAIFAVTKTLSEQHKIPLSTHTFRHLLKR